MISLGTLLNKLFSTEFQVMDESIRQQTTKGIWMAKARDSNILVLDVEGTDGRERGEDQDFERKSALFSLAIAEVVVINMWENMVGLYNGANMGLLKTVFAVNLELFQQKGAPKTCLCFVIRDYTGRTPIENLSETLMKDLEKIWASLNKPLGKENCTLYDFFDTTFAALPHKIYAFEQFDLKSKELQGRFYDKTHKDYIFQDKYHKKIPADGFPSFANSIWSAILSNRDLDLPSQQQLLAQYRCDEIERVAIESFSQNCARWTELLEKTEIIENLGKKMEDLFEATMGTSF